MRAIWMTFRRELGGYFATPVAYVFLVIFVALAGVLAFYAGRFLERGQADLQPFFSFHPWLYLVLIPALAMRLWAEERRAGTIEFLLTLPVRPTQAVIAKFLAAWVFAAVALVLTAPMWLTVAYLGSPDHGVILASYIGSFLLAGAYLAIGSALSALSRSQAVAFILAAAACFVLTVLGSPVALAIASGWAPPGVVEALATFSVLAHFDDIARGVIDLRAIVFLGSTILLFLVVNVLVLERVRA